MGLAFRKKKDMPTGLWLKCKACEKMVYKKQVEEKLGVCPECGFHGKIRGRRRIERGCSHGSADRSFGDNEPYGDKLEKSQAKTGLSEAAIVGSGTLKGMRVVLGVLDFTFFGGSMGQVVGERVTEAAERGRSQAVELVA